MPAWEERSVTAVTAGLPGEDKACGPVACGAGDHPERAGR